MRIDVSCPEYRGAPYPAFNPRKINESKFEDGLRAKEWNISISNNKTVGDIFWLSQCDKDPTEAWENEVKRAFMKNGFKGSVIHVKFGSRDTGVIHDYTLAV